MASSDHELARKLIKALERESGANGSSKYGQGGNGAGDRGGRAVYGQSDQLIRGRHYRAKDKGEGIVKILFSVVYNKNGVEYTRWYIGGHIPKPKFIAEFPYDWGSSGYLTSTGKGVNHWIAGFKYRSNDYTIQVVNGRDSSKNWTLTDPRCKFLSWIGDGFWGSTVHKPYIKLQDLKTEEDGSSNLSQLASVEGLREHSAIEGSSTIAVEYSEEYYWAGPAGFTASKKIIRQGEVTGINRPFQFTGNYVNIASDESINFVCSGVSDSPGYLGPGYAPCEGGDSISGSYVGPTFSASATITTGDIRFSSQLASINAKNGSISSLSGSLTHSVEPSTATKSFGITTPEQFGYVGFCREYTTGKYWSILYEGPYQAAVTYSSSNTGFVGGGRHSNTTMKTMFDSVGYQQQESAINNQISSATGQTLVAISPHSQKEEKLRITISQQAGRPATPSGEVTTISPWLCDGGFAAYYKSIAQEELSFGFSEIQEIEHGITPYYGGKWKNLTFVDLDGAEYELKNGNFNGSRVASKIVDAANAVFYEVASYANETKEVKVNLGDAFKKDIQQVVFVRKLTASGTEASLQSYQDCTKKKVNIYSLKVPELQGANDYGIAAARYSVPKPVKQDAPTAP